MKLFYLITKSEPGGAQTHVFQLARYASQQGHDVAIMSKPDGWLHDQATQNGWTFFENHHLANTMNPFALMRAGKRLKSALRTFKPDLVSCHSTVAGIVGRLTIRGIIPTVFTAHGWGFASGVPQPRKTLVLFAEKLAAKYTDRIICVSDFDRALGITSAIAQEDKLIRIHNGVEIPSQSKQAPEHPKNLLFVGRYVAQKDPLLLLEAFADIAPTHPELTLTLIGGGPKQEELETVVHEKGLAERVVMHGRMPRMDVLAQMDQADLFILTSNWEGLPRSILEALARAIPVITTNAGGSAEPLTRGGGIVIDVGDKQALIQAIKTLSTNTLAYQKASEAARVTAKEHFSLEHMLEQTFAVYENIV